MRKRRGPIIFSFRSLMFVSHFGLFIIYYCYYYYSYDYYHLLYQI